MEQLGTTNVRTFIQSGNVIFDSSRELAVTLETDLTKALKVQFRLVVPVIILSVKELEAALKANPYPDAVFTVIGRFIYLHLAGSAATTRLTNSYFDKRLKPLSTARN